MIQSTSAARANTPAWHLRTPRSAYVHVPFCAHRCGYCNFTLIAGRDDLIANYLNALSLELSALETPHEVDTLFLGGGTPTHLPPRDLERLLKLALHWFPLARGYEFSVEANPVDVDADRVACLARHGVNRLSLGAQSFNARKLTCLERDHSADNIERAVERARKHIEKISLDLIFGAPDETLEDWREDLRLALHVAPDHISTYGLTIERGTTFYGRFLRGALQPVDEETERAMYLDAIDRLGAAGFEHYEVSNFARSGARCRHNETYWSAKPYFAAGPGAARYVDGRREVNDRSVTRWMQRLERGERPIGETEELGPEDRAREALVLALRTLHGITRDEFRERTGAELDALAGRDIQPLVERGLLIDDGDRLRLSRDGLLVSDSIWPRILRA